VSHVNARLNVRGRLLLIERVLGDGRPVSHVASELGVSRQCAHRWVKRFQLEGLNGLADRSSRPRHSPRKTSVEVEARVLELRRHTRVGPARLGQELGIPTRTVGAILARNGVPRLSECDPLTGVVIRASRHTATRYERERPGELVHMDVKKLGRIPDGGGWKAHGRSEDVRGRGIGFDYVHSLIDDHSRFAYSEILPDEKGPSCAAFLLRAADYFAAHGITRIEQVMTDNAFAYRYSIRDAVTQLHAKQIFIRPHCPWQNGKVERLNRTLQTEWAYRQIFTSNTERAEALAPWIENYNTQRIHSAIGTTPIKRVSPT
jgi:transposase InsO family protein